jgi:hypothetical protein
VRGYDADPEIFSHPADPNPNLVLRCEAKPSLEGCSRDFPTAMAACCVLRGSAFGFAPQHEGVGRSLVSRPTLTPVPSPVRERGVEGMPPPLAALFNEEK